jgi:hypothetical protein
MEIILLSWAIGLSWLALSFLLEDKTTRDHAAAGLAARAAASQILAAKQEAGAGSRKKSGAGGVTKR